MSTLAQDFLNEIETFLKRAGMSATAFGRSALNDPNFVHDLRDGRMPSIALVDRVYGFMQVQDAAANSNSESAA